MLTYSVRFPGDPAETPIPLNVMTPRLRAVLERYWVRESPDLWMYPGYAAERLHHVPVPDRPPETPPRFNTLVWPTDASRWGVFHGIVSGPKAVAIAETMDPGAPTAQTLTISDGTNTVAVSMFAVAFRPVSVQGVDGLPTVEGDALGNLYWLTLVDPRYYWWQKQLTYSITAGDSWSTLLTNLINAASGQTPTVPTIPADYGTPNALRWDCPNKPLPLLIDAAAMTVGLRVVYRYDGVCELERASDAASYDAARWTANSQRVVMGGLADVTQQAATIPESVAVMSWGDTPEITTVTLASLGLTEFTGYSGVPGAYGWVAGDRYAGQASPTASDYATQAATDYYYWSLSSTDATFRGVVSDSPNGYDDRVEIEYMPARPQEAGDDAGDSLNTRLPGERVLTRIVRSNIGDLNVYGDRPPPGYVYPVRITAISGATYKAVMRTALTGSIADGPQVGFNANTYCLVNGDPSVTPAVGDYGIAIPDPLKNDQWVFIKDGASSGTTTLLVEVTVSAAAHTVKRLTWSGGAIADYSPPTTYTPCRSTTGGFLPSGTVCTMTPIPDVLGDYWITPAGYASATVPGLVSIEDQEFTGIKTFLDVINGEAGARLDFCYVTQTYSEFVNYSKDTFARIIVYDGGPLPVGGTTTSILADGSIMSSQGNNYPRTQYIKISNAIAVAELGLPAWPAVEFFLGGYTATWVYVQDSTQPGDSWPSLRQQGSARRVMARIKFAVEAGAVVPGPGGGTFAQDGITYNAQLPSGAVLTFAGGILVGAGANGVARKAVDTAVETLQAGQTYYADGGSQVQFYLSPAAVAGDRYTIIGRGSGGWKVNQRAGQTIYAFSPPPSAVLDATTTGTGGSISAIQYIVIDIECIEDGVDFVVINVNGPITIV